MFVLEGSSIKEYLGLLFFEFSFVKYDVCEVADRHFLEGFHPFVYFIRWDLKLCKLLYGGCVDGASNARGGNYCR